MGNKFEGIKDGQKKEIKYEKTVKKEKKEKIQKQKQNKSSSLIELNGIQKKENEEKIKEYIQFINRRKQQYSQNYPKEQSEEVQNTGPEVWLEEAKKLLESQLKNPKIKKTETILQLNDFLQSLDYSGFIRSFSNKCYLEYLTKLGVQPLGFKQRICQTVVSQDKVKDLLSDFFSNKNIIKNTDSQIEKKQSGDLFQSVNIQDQMMQNQKDRRKKLLIQKQLSIEIEITQKDHLIMCTINRFYEILHGKYNEIIKQSYLFKDQQEDQKCKDYMEQPKLQIIEDTTFLMRFLQKLIEKFYEDVLYDGNSKRKQEELFIELVIKSLCKNAKLFEILYQLAETENIIQIKKLSTRMRQRANITLQELDIVDAYCLEKDEQPYQLVLEHLHQIEQTNCLVSKFEMLGQTKELICDSIDQYYEKNRHEQYSNKKKQIDSDTFLSLLVYIIIKYGRPEILIHIKLIEMMLPPKISYDYGELSWVWISICSAIEYLMKLESIVESRGSNMDDIISCVIEQQLGDQRRFSTHLF